MAAPRTHYQDELNRLEERTLEGLDMVVVTLDRTLEAVARRDLELAELIVADDDRIDGRYIEVHQSILTMLATQAPVATDLRLIAALLHVMKNIERMGDQCVNIAKLIPVSTEAPHPREEMLSRIARMGDQVRVQILAAKRAFADRDAELARSLPRGDDLIDELNRECFGVALEMGEDQIAREWAMTMMLVARALERTGDYAVDIGEQVAFVVTGLFEEFEDASHPPE
ncbi:MAG: phosphate transport system protein [Solirubrobacterales bacterium]|jgi:phosphate transport system protein|nr:phosphate transport system protein [Solirubrobacterales bacterium]MDX6662847.1 phosphate transport system protein [Solirubrobacterales bacterium]